MTGKAKSLAELAALREALRREREAAAERAAQERARREAERRERERFADAVGPVTRSPAHQRAGTRADTRAPRPAPLPRQRERDEQAALASSLSDAFDVESLLETDDSLSYRRSGIGPDVLRRLRRGDWSIQAQFDLHGLRRDAAREALARFLAEAQRDGLRCVRVVHGKGLGSPGRTPVLKAHVRRWLVQCTGVVAFVQARAADGGAGALVVLLRAATRASGYGTASADTN